MAGERGVVRGLVGAAILLVLAGTIAVPGGVPASEPGPRPTETWCSLFEGDGVSPPGVEGWWEREFGGTISGGTIGADTVATVTDLSLTDGVWMQRYVEFEPPFKLSVRAQYSPSQGSQWVQMAYLFTGTHGFVATFNPTYMDLGGVPFIRLPMARGTWYNITFDARAPLDVDVYRDGVLVGNVEMFVTDRIIFDAPNNRPTIASLVSGPTTTGAGSIDYIRTTMCPIVDIGSKIPDRTRPITSNALLDDGFQTPANDLTVAKDVASVVTLTATADDAATGGSRIWTANYTQGVRAWPGTPMAAADGAIDSPTENVSAALDVTGLGLGDYLYCVYARDYYGNRDVTGSCATLRVRDLLPPAVTLLTLDDGAQPPSLTLTVDIGGPAGVRLNATLDDTESGDSAIAFANFTSGPTAWPGTPMSPADGAFDSAEETATAVLDPVALGPGDHRVCVYGGDATGNRNIAGACGLLRITYTPGTSQVSAISPYWWNSPATITATASDGSVPVTSVDLFYEYSADGTAWSAPTFWGTATSSPWAWTFTFPEGEGRYRFLSSARDDVGTEPLPSVANAEAGYDASGPSTSVVPVSPYLRAALPVTVQASGADPHSGLAAIELRYRFSPDNATWTPWRSLGEIDTAPFAWSFPALDGEGYYEFLSVGRDDVGNVEAPPLQRDASMRYGVAPTILSLDPADGATGIGTDIEVQVEFSEPMNRAATEAAFTLTAAGGSVPGTIRWIGGDTILVFTPTSPLAAGGHYTITLGTSATDRAGNRLASEVTGSFTILGPEPAIGVTNWKPVVAGVFAAILAAMAVGSRRNRRAFGAGLGFAGVEVATGMASVFVELLSVPPLLGIGMAVDLGILVGGLVVMFVLGRVGSRGIPPPPPT